jgi:phosphoglucosamine mutase
MEQFGIRVILAPVGDRYVLEQMLEHGAVLGGEQSGHVIFRHHATTGDGIITAVRFLSLAKRNDVTVAELASTMRRFPQVTINVEVAAKGQLEDAADVWDAVKAVEAALDGTGRVLVRSSGTEPLVRVMVEAESEQDARRHAGAIVERVRSALG